MTEKQINGRTIRLTRGDITALEIEAFVFDARPDLLLGSGFGGAIATRGGPSVQEELKKLAPIKVGEAVLTSAGKMKAKHIIHAVGPRFQEADEERKLREATLAALRRAAEKGIGKLALPPMGTGFYGVPLDLCARVMMAAVKEHLEQPETSLREVVFCLQDTREVGPFETALKALA